MCVFIVSKALLISSATVIVRAGGAIWLNPFATVLFSVCSAVTVECHSGFKLLCKLCRTSPPPDPDLPYFFFFPVIKPHSSICLHIFIELLKVIQSAGVCFVVSTHSLDPCLWGGGGVRSSHFWSTSQLIFPSCQQLHLSSGVCPQIQG